jgi:hypothetical protein
VIRYSQLLTPELWLPCRFEFTVRTQDLTGEEVEGGSFGPQFARLARWVGCSGPM